MVQIVRSFTPGPGTQSPMLFKVYLSPKDGKSVLGCVEPYGVIRENTCTWLQTQFGVPVAEALARAVKLAEHARVPVLLIDDPKGLLPPTQIAQ